MKSEFLNITERYLIIDLSGLFLSTYNAQEFKMKFRENLEHYIEVNDMNGENRYRKIVRMTDATHSIPVSRTPDGIWNIALFDAYGDKLFSDTFTIARMTYIIHAGSVCGLQYYHRN